MADSLTMTNIGLGSSGNGVLGGVYIGPYTVQVTGTTNTFKVICDDFLADTYIGESWTASISNLADLAGKFLPSPNNKYLQVGFLAEALFAYSGSTPCLIASCAGANIAADIQYAMWQVFGSPDAF